MRYKIENFLKRVIGSRLPAELATDAAVGYATGNAGMVVIFHFSVVALRYAITTLYGAYAVYKATKREPAPAT